MVDYKAIADASASYPNYQAAFAALSIEMGPDTYRSVSPHLLKQWAAQNQADYMTLRGGTDALSILAMSMIELESEPLQVQEAAVRGFISALAITDAGKNALLSLATKTNLAWPNLKEGHVQNAMQKRAAGVI